MWKLLGAGVLVCVAVLAGFALFASDGATSNDDAEVLRVVDGDTLVLTDERRVRLIGIDTPEVAGPGDPGGAECYGVRAAERTAELLPPGTELELAYDRERFDRYGRTLAYVHRARDGLFVNLALVEEGMAGPLVIWPNDAHAGDFAKGAQAARRAGRGLWRACVGNSPG